MQPSFKPLVIELFSGSKNVSNTFEKHGFNSFSIDNDCKLKPDLCIDILKLQPSMLPGTPSFIWASIPCTHFSRAAKSTHWVKTKISKVSHKYTAQTISAEKSILLLNKTIEILNLYPDTPFIIENPVGRIIHFDSLKYKGHFRYYVNYYHFGFNYSKETFLFSNFLLPLPVKRFKVNAPGTRTINGTFNRSKVPPALVDFIISHIPGHNNPKNFLKKITPNAL